MSQVIFRWRNQPSMTISKTLPAFTKTVVSICSPVCTYIISFHVYRNLHTIQAVARSNTYVRVIWFWLHSKSSCIIWSLQYYCFLFILAKKNTITWCWIYTLKKWFWIIATPILYYFRIMQVFPRNNCQDLLYTTCCNIIISW